MFFYGPDDYDDDREALDWEEWADNEDEVYDAIDDYDGTLQDDDDD